MKGHILAAAVLALTGCARDGSIILQPVGGKSASADSGTQKMLVCHKGKKTLELPSDAVQAHLKHGDRRGRC